MKKLKILSNKEGLTRKINTSRTANDAMVSELVGNHFTQPVKTQKKFDLLYFIEALNKPDICDDLDLKRSYYEDRSAKCGF